MMRRSANDGLATIVSALAIGIAGIAAVQVVIIDRNLYRAAANVVPEWTDKSGQDFSHMGFRNDAEKNEYLARKKAEHESHRKLAVDANVNKWVKGQWVIAIALMLCGLFAAGGVAVARVIRGKQQPTGLWRSR